MRLPLFSAVMSYRVLLSRLRTRAPRSTCSQPATRANWRFSFAKFILRVIRFQFDGGQLSFGVRRLVASRRAIFERIAICIGSTFAGAILGFVGGVVIAVLYTPERNPAEPLANEWHTLVVIASAFGGAIGGSIIGLFDGLFRRPETGVRSLVWGMLGALVGYLFSLSLPATGPEETPYRGVAVACLFSWACIVIGHFISRRRLTRRCS
jgi:hypothetical protein